jgi:hypothetical protein
MKGAFSFRTFLFAVFLVTTTNASFAVTPKEVEARITETFEAAQRALETDPSGLESQRILNQSRLIIDTIQPYFYMVPGALHEHSAARQMRVEQVEGSLGRYESFFVNLIGTLSNPKTDSKAITNYVKFTKPTPQIRFKGRTKRGCFRHEMPDLPTNPPPLIPLRPRHRYPSNPPPHAHRTPSRNRKILLPRHVPGRGSAHGL